MGQMDINSSEFAKKLIAAIDRRIEKKLEDFKPANWFTGKVAVAGSGVTISVYINNSLTTTTIRNPRGLNLLLNDLVFIWNPNSKVDNMSFIDHKL